MADDVVFPRMAVGLSRDQHHCTLFQGSRSGKVTLRGHRPTATHSASGSFHRPSPGPWRGTDLQLCDDDRLQDRHWLSRFVVGRAERSHDIICERGWNITERMGLARANPADPLFLTMQRPLALGGATT